MNTQYNTTLDRKSDNQMIVKNDLFTADAIVICTAPVSNKGGFSQYFLNQIGDIYRMGAIQTKPNAKPAHHFEKLQAHTEMLHAISQQLQGWLFASVDEKDVFLSSWRDAGFTPFDRVSVKKDENVVGYRYTMCKRCGVAERTNQMSMTENNLSWRDGKSVVSAITGTKPVDDVPADIVSRLPRLWNYHEEVRMIEDINVQSTRKSPIVRANFMREFLCQVGYMFPEELVCITVDAKDRLSFIAATDAGFQPVGAADNKIVFVKTMSWLDYGAEENPIVIDLAPMSAEEPKDNKVAKTTRGEKKAK